MNQEEHMNQGRYIMSNGEGSMSCFSETNSSSTVYMKSMPAATRSSEEDDGISLSLLLNLSTIQDKVHEIQSLVNFFMISPNNNNQESTSSLAMSNVGSLVQEIITAASSMMHTCQQLQISTSNNSNVDTNQTADGMFMEFSQDFDPDHAFMGESSTNLLGVQERGHVSFLDQTTQNLDWYETETTNPKKDIHHSKSRSGNYEIVELSVEDLLAKYTHYCQICGKGFKRDANLRMHMRAHGDEYKTREALINPTSRDKTVEYSSLMRHYYSCPQQGCRWNQRHEKFQPLKSVICAKNHYKRSHCPKIYMCRRCNVKHFSVLSDLRTHEKHCGDIKWVCSCGTRYVSPRTANRDAAAMIILVLVLIFIIRPAAQRIVNITPEGKSVRKLYLYGTIMTAVAASSYTTFFNQIHVLGAFMVGMAIPDGPPLGSALEAKFESLATNVFFPISIAVMTMKGDIIGVLYAFDDISFNIFLVGFTLVLKWTASFVPCLFFKLPTRESIIIAMIMNYKGFVDLCFIEGALNKWNLSHATYTFLMMYVLMNAGILPTIVKALYDPKRKYIGYVKRDVMHLKSNSDLKILTCLHKPDNISGMISLLQLLSSPLNNENKDKGVIAVTVLHLVKLAGRAFPILVPHDKRSKPRLLQNSYIQTMMLAFNEFQQENLGTTTVNSFTAFSIDNLMDQDICNLALDHLTSMIIIPSGRKWSPDGSYESDDVMIRRVNMSLLDRAPCSIGVLNNRGHRKLKINKRSKGTVKVGVIFVGGKDDWEAVSIAKWMRQNPSVRLTVIRFLSGQEPDKSKNWEYLVDNEVLNDLKATYASAENFSYTEKIIKGGPAVATAVRMAAEENDLMIVGRDHDDDSLDYSGLVEWMELPELGVIGDLLASKELETRVSVLVVKQQQQHE
ncbi:hypothetical protein DY000_02001006 [Brassica cretica]|uniref:C2H2-type domain-containing protein n=1 Tax=Brassica cretica TaxID=69181 RepID=A0ABQ7C2H6_BRACR|nr:hypothetical protein DY000_02001006 [Brassica cretica]